MLSWEGEEGPGSFCDYATRAVEREFREHDLQVSSWLKADAQSTEKDIAKWLQIIKSRGRSKRGFSQTCHHPRIFSGTLSLR